jgi:N-acylglucosamine-6-phosphate 2-epimerase
VATIMRTNENSAVISKLKNGLIVSCQAPPNSPLNQPDIIAAMARVAEQQGAVAVRINGVENIRAVRRRVSIALIGLEKRQFDGSPVYITPTWELVRHVYRAGADIVALDCTDRPRPDGQSLAKIIQNARGKLGAPVMADVATVEQGLAAVALGADLVATTLHGYTGEAQAFREPAFTLLESLVRQAEVPVIMEGRVHTPEQLRRAFDLGAFAVVVGTAITNLEWLVQRFIEATLIGKQVSSASGID